MGCLLWKTEDSGPLTVADRLPVTLPSDSECYLIV